VIALSVAEVAAVVDGRLDAVADEDAMVTGVTTDSRDLEAGALFVALEGERVDGHDYAVAAVRAGAAAVLAARPVGVPAVVVDDVVVALGRLARAVLDRLPGLTVVAVTGSSGKTSTKDLLAAVLAPMGPTVAPLGSFNNDIGHPLTVLRVTEATRYLVLECSARGVGHIARLCRIAPPRIGLELNVGVAHIGEFGSQEVIARSKAELVAALPADGVAVLNADDPLVLAMADATPARVLTFGRAGTADVRAVDVELDERGRPGFTLRAPAGQRRVQLALYGEHHVSNALAAAAVALELGAGLGPVAQALAAATPASRWRMEVSTRSDGVTVINDAYNANPDSMGAALRALAAIAAGRRSWAVLGAMGELGATADDEHEAIGRLAVGLGVERLVVVGAGATRLHAGARAAGLPADQAVLVLDVDAAVGLLREGLSPEDVVLVKASRAAGLERVAAGLLDEPAQVPA